MKTIKLLTLASMAALMLACGGSKESAADESAEMPVEEAVVEIVGEEVNYSADSVTMSGYLAYNASNEEKRPGIIVVHEWWGHNDYARKRADMLAELGYTALAVDMYGDGKIAGHPSDAGTFAGMVMSNMSGAKERFMAAMEVLRNHPSVDAEQTAAIGYCFGGGIVLNMALMGADLDGVVSFHGSLPVADPDPETATTSKVLVCHGANDSFITPETIEQFQALMSSEGIEMEFVEYADAIHSFTNPGADAIDEEFGIGVGYSEAADKQSWEDMKRFLGEIF